jgi:hypothetical protein
VKQNGFGLLQLVQAMVGSIRIEVMTSIFYNCWLSKGVMLPEFLMPGVNVLVVVNFRRLGDILIKEIRTQVLYVKRK